VTDQPEPIDPSRAALLVMDYQVGVIGMVGDADQLVDRVKETIALVRNRGGAVGYVRVAFTDADFEGVPSTSLMAARVAQAGDAFHADSPTTAIDERISPEPHDIVVRKTRVGAFLTTDLDQQLRHRGIDTVVLAGISTSGVILSTVREASDRDYRIVVLSDVCADRDPEVHEFLTTRIFPSQASVITTAELEELLPAA
jgi:nicotinamidase-related amidase